MWGISCPTHGFCVAAGQGRKVLTSTDPFAKAPVKKGTKAARGPGARTSLITFHPGKRVDQRKGGARVDLPLPLDRQSGPLQMPDQQAQAEDLQLAEALPPAAPATSTSRSTRSARPASRARRPATASGSARSSSPALGHLPARRAATPGVPGGGSPLSGTAYLDSFSAARLRLGPGVGSRRERPLSQTPSPVLASTQRRQASSRRLLAGSDAADPRRNPPTPAISPPPKPAPAHRGHGRQSRSNRRRLSPEPARQSALGGPEAAR